MRKIIPAILLLSGMLAHAQAASVKARIGDAFASYFEQDRENVYVRFDKQMFFTEEEAWFKGFVFNKSNHTPFFETVNMYAVLYDQSGRQVREQLVFCYLGSFSGSFSLTGLPSGRYYAQFYTNWMNNFPEDESAVVPIQVAQPSDTTVADYDTPHPELAAVSFFPEGGTLLEGAMNNVGIRIADCAGHPLSASDGAIVDEKGQPVAHFLIDANGCGKAGFTPSAQKYKAVLSVSGHKIEAALPAVSLTGIAIEANGYAVAGKLLLKIRTNPRSLASLQEKPLYAVVQQDNKTTIYDVAFNGAEADMLIPSTDLFPGLNVIRLIDGGLNQLAERLIFEPVPAETPLNFSFTKLDGGRIRLYGSGPVAQADMCVVATPENISPTGTTIATALKIDPYLKSPLPPIADMTAETSKGKRYMLDLLLLNQPGGKYDWRDVIAGAPKISHSFDLGLTIKGTISQPLQNPKNYRMLLSVPQAMINDYSAISSDNSFQFPNLLFSNQALFSFSLLKIPSVPTPEKFTEKIENRKRPFLKPFRPPVPCPVSMVALDAPQFGKDVIPLKEVVVETDKHELRYQTKMGNAMLRGYKIEAADHGSLLSYIGAHGFNVSRQNGHVTITTGHSGFSGAPSKPEVYVSDHIIMSFDDLDDTRIEDVDEIYMDPHAVVASMQNKTGIIRIYMKKIDLGPGKSTALNVQVKDGFSPVKKFSCPLYADVRSEAFRKFGVLQWQPNVIPDEKGEFHFDLPDTGCSKITLDVQYIGSQRQTLSLE
jgi:hypothetical protein